MRALLRILAFRRIVVVPFVALIAGPAAFGLASAQDSPSTASKPTAETRPATAETRPSDPVAREFLLDAAKRRAPMGEVEIRDVTIRFEAESNLNGAHNETAEATHQFQRPNKIRTNLTAAGSSVLRGFDGKQYWIQREEKVEILSGRENERDRNDIDYSVRFTEHLLQLIALSSLSERMTELSLLTPEVLDPKSKSGPSPGVKGILKSFPSLRAGALRTVTAELRFDAATRDLVQVRVWIADPTGDASKDPETLLFSDYRVVKGKNVRFPYRVTAYTTNMDLPEYKFQVLEVDWNSGLDAAIFTPVK